MEGTEAFKLTYNTFLYFFSTAAQCEAAIAALSLVAAQMRISFLDEKVTAAKEATASYWVSVNIPNSLAFEMARLEASEVLVKAKEKINTGAKVPHAESLERALNQIQESRTASLRLIIGLLVATMISLVQLPFSEFFGNLAYENQKNILLANVALLLVGTIMMTVTLGRVLGVGLKKRLS